MAEQQPTIPLKHDFKRQYDPEALQQWRRERDIHVARLVDAKLKSWIGDREIPEDDLVVLREAARSVVPNDHPSGMLPKIAYMDVLRLKPGGLWNLSPKLKEAGEHEGWLSTADGKVTIKTGPDDDDVVFEILRPPGHYCCICGKKLNNSIEAARHMKDFHTVAGKPIKSPDPNNPSGWRHSPQFELRYLSGKPKQDSRVLEESSHKRAEGHRNSVDPLVTPAPTPSA